MLIDELYSNYLNSNCKVYTDTRKPIEGALFFALKGPGFNGNEFANIALSQGASFAVVDEELISQSSKTIKVDNVLKTLQRLASFHRDNCKAKIFAIGGSNGKTTTKELLKKVLESDYHVHATPGNYNNHIGLPLTILSMPIETEIALLELGTNQKGDIEELCGICKPDFGLITNIGKEHLEGFGDIEAIAKEESYLYEFINKNGGQAFINMDDFWLSNMSKRFKNYVGYSVSDFEIKKLAPSIEALSKTKTEFKSHLAGIHNVSNIAATRAVGISFGIEEHKISEAISSYISNNMRSEWKQTENNLIFLDAYNANPSSMEAAIKTIIEIESEHKIAILGDMFELGNHASEEHKNILKYALNAGFDKVITVGKEFYKHTDNEYRFEIIEDLIVFLQNNKFTDNVILVKGSRGMKLEQVVPYL